MARSTSDLYRIISELAEKGVSFTVDRHHLPRTGKLVMGILAWGISAAISGFLRFSCPWTAAELAL